MCLCGTISAQCTTRSATTCRTNHAPMRRIQVYTVDYAQGNLAGMMASPRSSRRFAVIPAPPVSLSSPSNQPTASVAGPRCVIHILIAPKMSRAAPLLRHRAVRHKRTCHGVENRARAHSSLHPKEHHPPPTPAEDAAHLPTYLTDGLGVVAILGVQLHELSPDGSSIRHMFAVPLSSAAVITAAPSSNRATWRGLSPPPPRKLIGKANCPRHGSSSSVFQGYHVPVGGVEPRKLE